MSSLFGTDGIRGPFGVPPLDEGTVRRLGAALGAHLGAADPEPRVVLGGDTRHSTITLCGWLAHELSLAGCEVLFGGVLPTPAIAYLVGATGSATGIAVSASHNPLPDNGIKLLDAAGGKWEHEAEGELTARLDSTAPRTDRTPTDPRADVRLGDDYLEHLAALAPGERPLGGLEVVLDCANGAASSLAPRLFERLGASVRLLAARPDGHNINLDCGSTSPAHMADAVVEARARIGFAFDGDADRVVAADETGQIRDGDAILYVLAHSLARRGALDPPRLVATSMSNIGLELALARSGIDLVRCDVGDREVVQTLKREGLLLGGEQSGHIVRLDLSPTGDGLLTALLVSLAVVDSGKELSELLADFATFPQILHNVPVPSKPDLASLPSVAAAARSVEENLGSQGRLVLRYSGTEPLARIMIEGPDQERIEDLAQKLEAAIRRDIGEATPR